MAGRGLFRLSAAVALAGLLSVVLAVAADARDSAEVAAARAFGLLGVWAIDCAKPASRENGYLGYVVEGARLIHTRRFGDMSDRQQVLGAKIGTDGRLEILLDLPQFKQRRRFVLMKEGADRIRSMANWQDGTADYSVKDGILVGSGKPTPWQMRCSSAQARL